MRISDWSSDVCSSDLRTALDEPITKSRIQEGIGQFPAPGPRERHRCADLHALPAGPTDIVVTAAPADVAGHTQFVVGVRAKQCRLNLHAAVASPLAADFQIAADCRLQIECQARAAVSAIARSEEHTSELQSLMRNSYA